MSQVPSGIALEFERRMEWAGVPTSGRLDGRKWLRFCLDFFQTTAIRPGVVARLEPSAGMLASRNQSAGQAQAAAAGVKLFLRLASR